MGWGAQDGWVVACLGGWAWGTEGGGGSNLVAQERRHKTGKPLALHRTSHHSLLFFWCLLYDTPPTTPYPSPVPTLPTPPQRPPPLRWFPSGPLVLLHPYEQTVEQRAAALLGDPLDLGVAEARVQGLAQAQRLGAHLVGAGPHAHLQRHLGLVAAVGSRVPESDRRSSRVRNERL